MINNKYRNKCLLFNRIKYSITNFHNDNLFVHLRAINIIY